MCLDFTNIHSNPKERHEIFSSDLFLGMEITNIRVLIIINHAPWKKYY